MYRINVVSVFLIFASIASAQDVVDVAELGVPRAARRDYERGRKVQAKDCAAALTYFQRAVDRYGEYWQAHNESGNCHVVLKNWTAAEESFQRAIALTKSVFPALNLADVYSSSGQVESAEATLLRAIERNPSAGDGYYGLACLRFRQARLAEAVTLAGQAHARSHFVADVHLLLAKIYLAQGKSMAVTAELQQYLKEAKAGPSRDRIQKALAKHAR